MGIFIISRFKLGAIAVSYRKDPAITEVDKAIPLLDMSIGAELSSAQCCQ